MFFNIRFDMFEFGRPATGVYSGGIGGAYGSLMFGPPFMGPFNNPALRISRIEQIFDNNRRINRRPLMDEQFRLDDRFIENPFD